MTQLTAPAGSRLGWLEFSDAALRRMQSELEDSGKGVVDEVGVLGIHSAYADRFFPGTSVLHTRPRYLFFVAWHFLHIQAHCRTAQEAEAELDRLTLWLARRLNESEKLGVIGGTLVDEPRLPSQPPHYIYWSALNEFRLYRGPRPKQIVSQFPKIAVVRANEPLDAADWGFPIAQFDAPSLPAGWGSKRGPHPEVNFRLSLEEAQLLQERLSALQREDGGDCLFGVLSRRILEAPKSLDDLPWRDPFIRECASECGELERLERARYGASIAELVRAVYAALVEQQRNRELTENDARTTEHQQYLLELCLEVDLNGYRGAEAVDGIPTKTARMIEHVVERFKRLSQSGAIEAGLSSSLLDEPTYQIFCDQERGRKGDRRARLGRTGFGEELRRAFGAASASRGPVNYRWLQVRQILEDLHEGLLS